MEQRNERKATRKSRKEKLLADSKTKTGKGDEMKPLVLYCYVDKKNKSFIQKLADENNQSVSHVADEMIASIREGRKFSISKAVPKFVQKADKWKQAHGA